MRVTAQLSRFLPRHLPSSFLSHSSQHWGPDVNETRCSNPQGWVGTQGKGVGKHPVLSFPLSGPRWSPTVQWQGLPGGRCYCPGHTKDGWVLYLRVPSALRPERCIRSKRADWDPWPGLPPAPRVRESKTKGHHSVSTSLAMNLEPPKAEVRSATRVTGGPVTPRKGPPKFKQRQTRQFKSKPPKKGIQG